MSEEQIKARLDEIENLLQECRFESSSQPPKMEDLLWLCTQLRESLAREEELNELYKAQNRKDFDLEKAMLGELNDDLKKCWAETKKERNQLRADLQMVTDFLEHKSKRSSYFWSQGGNYLSCDYENEAQISLATELLSKLKSRSKTEG